MTEPIGCDLCGDATSQMFLRARCHPTAPLRAVLEDDVLTLRCYLPDCDREVVHFDFTRHAALVRDLEALHRYTVTSEAASPGYFRLVEDAHGVWVQWAEVQSVLAAHREPR